MGISSIPFHGVSVDINSLNVILIWGWFFLILSKISVGSLKGKMTRRFSGSGSALPMMVEASKASREDAIASLCEQGMGGITVD